jgi:hypothetical protein
MTQESSAPRQGADRTDSAPTPPNVVPVEETAHPTETPIPANANAQKSISIVSG